MDKMEGGQSRGRERHWGSMSQSGREACWRGQASGSEAEMDEKEPELGDRLGSSGDRWIVGQALVFGRSS